jgi:hypothetical protein
VSGPTLKEFDLELVLGVVKESHDYFTGYACIPYDAQAVTVNLLVKVDLVLAEEFFRDDEASFKKVFR